VYVYADDEDVLLTECVCSYVSCVAVMTMKLSCCCVISVIVVTTHTASRSVTHCVHFSSYLCAAAVISFKFPVLWVHIFLEEELIVHQDTDELSH